MQNTISTPSDSLFQVPQPINETVLNYPPGSSERSSLKNRLESMAKEKIEIPCIIAGREIFTGDKVTVVMPHDHGHVLAEVHLARVEELEAAAQAALNAKGAWEALGWNERAAVFLKAADLIAGPYRDTLNAATMLGQSKTVYQAEIDAACELIDFLRFNVFFYQEILKNQPQSSRGMWNRMDYRPLEGFVTAITPFNFTAIAGNLPAAPTLLGNTVVWKPATTQVLAGYYTMRLFEKAGLPAGVINFVPSRGSLFGKTLLKKRDLAGIHFTGSTQTFQTLYQTIGENIATYRSYPRIVGETGGKDFIFAHPSADPAPLVTAMIRGSFEYQGQKCSAASRAYIPVSLWSKIKKPLLEQIREIKMGDVRDFRNFMGAVIDEASFDTIHSYIGLANESNEAEILIGGETSKKSGYFVPPTVIQAHNPKFKTMCEEIFGPVLSLFVYEDRNLEQAIELCDISSPYALTGSIFAQDRNVIASLTQKFRHAAGNFYINDKPTGAVVGQQPFGGARASGTNDKSGSYLNLLRWLSPRSIKETFVPPTDYRYSYMGDH